MFKRRITEMEIGPDTYREIMKCHSDAMTNDARYRSMLVSLKPGCYVETYDNHGGNVIDVERDKYDIPMRVSTTSERYDGSADKRSYADAEWVDVGDIVFWEAWDFIAPQYLFEDENALFGELMFESEVK